MPFYQGFSGTSQIRSILLWNSHSLNSKHEVVICAAQIRRGHRPLATDHRVRNERRHWACFHRSDGHRHHHLADGPVGIEEIHFLSDPSPIMHWLCLSLTHSLTNSVTFSKLDWCDPGVWRCQLKTCWGCHFCWCWWWGSRWQQFVADLKLRFGHEAKLFQTLSTRSGRDSEGGCWFLVEVKKLNLGQDSEVWLRF